MFTPFGGMSENMTLNVVSISVNAMHDALLEATMLVQAKRVRRCQFSIDHGGVISLSLERSLWNSFKFPPSFS
jgi:hypothetical protein